MPSECRLQMSILMCILTQQYMPKRHYTVLQYTNLYYTVISYLTWEQLFECSQTTYVITVLLPDKFKKKGTCQYRICKYVNN